MEEDSLAKVVETTTHKSMSSPEHHARFDDHRIAKAFAEINGLAWPRELTGAHNIIMPPLLAQATEQTLRLGSWICV
jgi:glycine/serine hydroxymethyltransferase